MRTRFLRRFIVPTAASICVATGVIVAILLIGSRESAVLWPVMTLAVCAMISSMAFAYAALRRQSAETIDLFEKIISFHEPSRAANTRAGASDLANLAERFGDALRQSVKDQAQLLTIISSMSDGLIATDHDQRILLTNAAAEELMCFRARHAEGKQLWEIVPIEAILESVTQVSLTGQQQTISVGPVENRYLHVTVCRLPLRPAGFVIVASDVTEAMRYEGLRKEFVANVSHELRTPLTVIKGYIETLRDGALADPARAAQYLATVDKHADHLVNLVQDLLSLSRLDDTSYVDHPQPTDVQAVVTRVRDLLQPAAAKKGHTLTAEYDAAAPPPMVIADPQYLERAVANLVDNAIKYTKNGGHIAIAVRGDGAQALIEVTDDGIGIAEMDLPRIFERFYRAERSRSRDLGGTGLGLAIAKHIVQVHGGSIDVASTPGRGSTFRIRLPAAPAAAAGGGAGAGRPPARST